jgi:glycosyltransferase involved in cell wall biosynthesis
MACGPAVFCRLEVDTKVSPGESFHPRRQAFEPMAKISVIVCTHNPRRDYLRRVLDALNAQTLPKQDWELLVVDNASDERLAETCDLSWHPRARHIREDDLGLTPARLRGITEARGELLVFVDDDNLPASDFLEQAAGIHGQYPYLGAFGAGSLEPEFEVQPPPEIRPRVHLLALRNVSSVRWSNNASDFDSIPWGAGLCVSRPVANLYRQFIGTLDVTAFFLDRSGQELFSGGDDVFSWVAVSAGCGFGIFPQLRITHLIAAGRLNRRYFLRLIHDHTFSSSVRHYVLAGIQPRRIEWTRYAHVLLHGVRNGRFSMRCQWAESSGEDRAARFILEQRLRPLRMAGLAALSTPSNMPPTRHLSPQKPRDTSRADIRD